MEFDFNNERFNYGVKWKGFKLTIVLKIEMVTRGVYFWNVTRGVYCDEQKKTNKKIILIHNYKRSFKWQQNVTQILNSNIDFVPR